MTSARLLEVDELSVVFSTARGEVYGVDGVSFTLDHGETLGVVGESGSGKSVTATSLIGVRPPLTRVRTSGSARLEGRELLDMSEAELRGIRGAEIGYVFQDPMTALDPSIPVGNQIVETLLVHTGLDKAGAQRRAVELLDMVGIPNAAASTRNLPDQFSGGMRQRILVALAISCRPKLLIADEATTALDPTVQTQILALLRSLCRELSMAMIMITHDFGVVAATCDRVQVMYAGRIVERGSVADVLTGPRHPYTAGLLRLAPRLEINHHHRLRPIPGRAPTAIRNEPGCRFSPRCEFADDRCHREEPPWSDGLTHASACWRNPAELASRDGGQAELASRDGGQAELASRDRGQAESTMLDRDREPR
ncbi:ABC transporter ATP-binding protein [Plantactinospora mayteni]|uniref:ABC transporter ATP-binding protein n=1 Tax=Plantactinospora mayteni TaxID=566021 RepID=A0ABQ4ERB9_9ACTN|nr:ABC transporter ATP-binding protein [Plantactinospora mayteni]GIG97181.1 ABC transporter ATP-binding protein [Plantactinospora mayteni]